MKKDKRIVINIVYVIIGAILICLSIVGKVDEFWNGMGSVLFVIGILKLLRYYRINKNVAYHEKIEIEEQDERNHFLRNKAWAWSGYLFIIIAGVSCIVLKIMGQELLSMVASWAICLMMTLFWISYIVLKRKY